MVHPPSRGSCLPLFPFVSWGASALPEGLVSPCVLLSPLVSLCLPLCHLSPRWMVCPPSPESCLPLSPFLFPFWFPSFFPFVGWCLLPESLVSSFLPLTPLLPLLVSLCWLVCPPSRGDKLTPLVSPCLPSWSPSGVLLGLLGVLYAFLRWPPWCWMVCPPSPRSCLHLSPIVPLLSCFPLSPIAHCTWMVRLPFGGSCLPVPPIVPLLDSPCWKVCSPCRRSCLPLSPIVPLLVSLCWTPSRGCFPLYPWLVPCGDGVSAFLTVLSPIVPLLVSLCWMVRPPSWGSFLLPRVLSPSVSACTPSCFPSLAGVSAFPSILPPFSPHYLLSCPPNSVLL